MKEEHNKKIFLISDMVHYLRNIEDREERDNYVSKLKEPIKTYVIDALVRLLRK